MLRIVIALVLIGAGAFFGWEAHNVLTMDWFELANQMGPNAHLTSADLDLLNSPAADISEKLGADTYGELDNYLTVMRVAGIVTVISGVVLIATRTKTAPSKKYKKS